MAAAAEVAAEVAVSAPAVLVERAERAMLEPRPVDLELWAGMRL
jgi:hypothetical protein